MEDRRTCLLCDKRATQNHHPAGRRNDPKLTVELCAACHASLHRDMEDLGVKLDSSDRSSLERLVSFLQGLAVLFLEIGRRLIDSANVLASLLQGERPTLKRRRWNRSPSPSGHGSARRQSDGVRQRGGGRTCRDSPSSSTWRRQLTRRRH